MTAWGSVIPQLLVMGGLIFVIDIVVRPELWTTSMFWGALIYLLYSFGSKLVLLRDFRQGIRAMRAEQYPQAVEQFGRSHAFLTKYPWIDRYRAFTLLDSSPVSYEEKTLLNMAYAYVQMEDAVSAERIYRQVLKQFPESTIARSALQTIDSVKQGKGQ